MRRAAVGPFSFGIYFRGQSGRGGEILANGKTAQLLENHPARQPEDLRCQSLSLEEIFVAAGTLAKAR